MATPNPPKGHAYPGVNLPLRFIKQDGEGGVDFYRLGSSDGLVDTASDLLPAREVAMMILMDRLSDKPGWEDKVFRDDIVAKWRQEALSQDEEGLYRQILDGKKAPMPARARLISERAFDYCIAELRCKAEHFKQTGLVFTVNSDINTAIKSDTLVSDELHHGLRAAFAQLRADQAAEPDWHPGTNDQVQDLVHPSMYPLVYGKSKFIQDEVVGVTDAVDKWAGKGEPVPVALSESESDGSAPWRPEAINESYWSSTYQWLPANLAFREDGTVRFTSYINNLHPKKYPGVYRLIENLIDTAIPAWDRVLSFSPVVGDADKRKSQKRFGDPPSVFDEDQEDVWEKLKPDVLAAYERDNGPILQDDEETQENLEYMDEDEETKQLATEEAKTARKLQILKWREIRDPLLPEPLEFAPVTYAVAQTLRSKFSDTGLQVIVKMASIELTPEKPDFPAGGWHIEGQMNEHIVATALYYVDSENVTPSSLSFRMMTLQSQEDLENQAGQDQYRPYEYIYGTRLSLNPDAHNVQTYGNVETRERRLLAFPNVFQHRVSSFTLQDRTKPGHRRFLALWLVDPHRRVVSTANVPPQQLDWWSEAVFIGGGGGESAAAKGDMPAELFQLLLEQGAARTVSPSPAMLRTLVNRLPAEVMEMVRREGVVPGGLMTREEARKHRGVLMEERSTFRSSNEEEWTQEYSFCEH